MTVDTMLSIGVIPIMGLMLQIFKMGIDNINMEGIEKKFITNSKYYGILGSNLLIISLLFGGAAILFSYMLGIHEYKDFKSFLNDSRVTILAVFSYVLLWFAILYWTTSLLAVKSRYYLYLAGDPINRWNIVRRLDKNKTLLSNRENKFKLYENSNLYNLTIHKSLIAPSERVMKLTFKINRLKKQVSIINILLIIGIITIWLLKILNIILYNPFALTAIFTHLFLLLYTMSSIVKGNMELLIGSSCDLNESLED